jgi:hypothetical protein
MHGSYGSLRSPEEVAVAGEHDRDAGDAGGTSPLDPGDDLGPYLALARELKLEADRLAAQPFADLEDMTSVFERIPDAARAEVVARTFDQLSTAERWAVLERLFPDEELRRHLAARRDALVAEARRAGEADAVVVAARAHGELDVAALPEGHVVELGLFRPVDVRYGLARGIESDTVARSLQVRSTASPGTVRVVDDRFNPRRGLYVSGEYDSSVFEQERLESNVLVRVGRLAGDGLEPRIEPGARFDVDRGDGPEAGRLAVGYVVVDGVDLFTIRTSPSA